jgi:hypothetical protein
MHSLKMEKPGKSWKNVTWICNMGSENKSPGKVIFTLLFDEIFPTVVCFSFPGNAPHEYELFGVGNL